MHLKKKHVIRALVMITLASCSKSGSHSEQEQRPSVQSARASEGDMPSTERQNEDQTAWIIRACGTPSRDYEDSQTGTTWRHLVYGHQHVELAYQRFPGWTYIGATDPRDTVYGEALESEEVTRRLPCSRGKLRTPLDH